MEERARHTGPLVRTAAVKLFVDGVIETHTAHLAEPYADRPGDRGPLVWAPSGCVEASLAAARPGSSSTTTPSATPPSLWPRRDRGGAAPAPAPQALARDIITHLQLVDPPTTRGSPSLGVVAAVQPYWFDQGCRLPTRESTGPSWAARAPTTSTP